MSRAAVQGVCAERCACRLGVGIPVGVCVWVRSISVRVWNPQAPDGRDKKGATRVRMRSKVC